MALRMTPEEYYRGKIKVQPQPNLPPVVDAYFPHYIANDIHQPNISMFNPNAGLIVLGIVAVVGLLGLFAVLATTKNKCER